MDTAGTVGSTMLAASMRHPLPEKRLTGVYVLIVDDSRNTSAVLRGCLEEHGASVGVAQSVEAGLVRYRSSWPDLVIADLAMRGLHGEHFLSEIRSGVAGDSVPVVAITAYPQLRRVLGGFRRSSSERFDGFLKRPFDTEQVIAVVASLVGR